MDLLKASEILTKIFEIKNKHKNTWRDKPDIYWLSRMQEEFLELGLALRNEHEHTPELELMQIVSIALNWLELRSERIGK